MQDSLSMLFWYEPDYIEKLYKFPSFWDRSTDLATESPKSLSGYNLARSGARAWLLLMRS
ncbi:hypothetical protein MASSI9I_20250 [Massilia sp. 9I]|nr:hypothetical protein MASSI9I_20250 [Massilia sp. 9I]